MSKDQLIIFDTTLRDGEQSPGASMTLDEKVRIGKALERLRVDVIEAGFAVASQGDFEAVRAVAVRRHVALMIRPVVQPRDPAAAALGTFARDERRIRRGRCRAGCAEYAAEDGLKRVHDRRRPRWRPRPQSGWRRLSA